MATTIKISKTQRIQDQIIADKCSLRKGIYTAKWFFFYSHGATAQSWANKVTNVFPKAEIISANQRWNAWLKDSWFEVCFILHE